jgi:hypothetical protein
MNLKLRRSDIMRYMPPYGAREISMLVRFYKDAAPTELALGLDER